MGVWLLYLKIIYFQSLSPQNSLDITDFLLILLGSEVREAKPQLHKSKGHSEHWSFMTLCREEIRMASFKFNDFYLKEATQMHIFRFFFLTCQFGRKGSIPGWCFNLQSHN